MEILGRRMNVDDGKSKTLEGFTFEETGNIHKKFEGRQRTEFQIKETVTSLECRLIEVLSTIITLNVEVKHSRKAYRLKDLHHLTVIGRPGLRLPRHLYCKESSTLKRGKTFFETSRITSSIAGSIVKKIISTLSYCIFLRRSCYGGGTKKPRLGRVRAPSTSGNNSVRNSRKPSSLTMLCTRLSSI